MKSVDESLMEALKQFKEQGNVEKVKNHLNPALLPSDPDDLFVFLYDQITHIWLWYVHHSYHPMPMQASFPG